LLKIWQHQHSANLDEWGDDYAFDVFNLIVLSLAQRAINEPDFKIFIKKSIKQFWIF
jgi:hypothetical protein